MTVPDPMAAIRAAMLAESSITDLLLPQTTLAELTVAPIFVQAYPRRVAGAPATGYTGHDWSSLLHQRAIEMLLIMPTGRATSGGDTSRALWSRPRFDVMSYGRTFATAGALHWAAYEWLKDLFRVRATLSTGTALIHDVTVEGGPISFVDPDTDSPVMVGVYAASIAEEFVEVA